VYFGAPLTEFETLRYAHLSRVARDRYTGCVVLEAKRLFASSDHWIGTWPTLLPTLDELVFITTADGWVGKGLAYEIDTAEAMGIPVLCLADDGRLHELPSLRRSPPNEASWHRYQRITLPDLPSPPAPRRRATRRLAP
jgi:hypothetical protein